MATSYRRYDPNQALLLPPSLQDWLPEDHLAYFVSDTIDQLDLRSRLARLVPPSNDAKVGPQLARRENSLSPI
jgi:hypothetical protein